MCVRAQTPGLRVGRENAETPAARTRRPADHGMSLASVWPPMSCRPTSGYLLMVVIIVVVAPLSRSVGLRALR